MTPFNPYESPQVELSHNLPKQTDRDFIASILGPDWLEVCDGARYCIRSTKIGLVAALAALLTFVCIDLSQQSLAVAFFLIAVAITVYAIVIQAIGIQKLRLVSIETQAKGNFTIAMFLQMLHWLSLPITFICFRLINTSKGQNFENQLLIILCVVNAIIFLIYHFSFLLGLRRIGIVLNNATISRDARNTALLAFGIPSYLALRFFRRLPTSWVGLLFGFLVVMVFVVGRTTLLSRIANYRKQYDYRSKDVELKNYFDQVSDPQLPID